MKIGLVASQPLSESMGTSSTIMGFGSALADLGQEIHILAPGQETRVVKHNLTLHGYDGFGVSLLYKESRRLYNSPLLARRTVLRPKIIRSVIARFGVTISKWLQNLRLDIVEGEQGIAARASLDEAKKVGLPCISHFHNLWYQECLELGLLRSNDPELRSLEELTWGIIEDSDAVITPTEFMREFLMSRSGKSSSEIIHVPRGTTARLKAEIPPRTHNRLVYAGTLAMTQGFHLLFQAIRVSAGDHEYVLCGKGEDEKKIRNMARDLGLNIKFCWFDNKNEYFEFLSKCSVGVIPWAKTPSRQLGFPMKLLDYMSGGLPVICSQLGIWTSLVESHQLRVVLPSNPGHWASSIDALLGDSDKTRLMGTRALLLSRGEFSWARCAKRLLETYQELS